VLRFIEKIMVLLFLSGGIFGGLNRRELQFKINKFLGDI
jgi:hypothetical protein